MTHTEKQHMLNPICACTNTRKAEDANFLQVHAEVSYSAYTKECVHQCQPHDRLGKKEKRKKTLVMGKTNKLSHGGSTCSDINSTP